MNSSATRSKPLWTIGVLGLMTATLVGYLCFASYSNFTSSMRRQNELRSKIANTNSLFRSLSKLHDLYLEENGKAITQASELGRLKAYFSPEFQKQQHLSESEALILITKGFVGRDPFDSEIRIESDSINYLYFVSDGPDGIPNTVDDISRRFSWVQQ